MKTFTRVLTTSVVVQKSTYVTTLIGTGLKDTDGKFAPVSTTQPEYQHRSQRNKQKIGTGLNNTGGKSAPVATTQVENWHGLSDTGGKISPVSMTQKVNWQRSQQYR